MTDLTIKDIKRARKYFHHGVVSRDDFNVDYVSNEHKHHNDVIQGIKDSGDFQMGSGLTNAQKDKLSIAHDLSRYSQETQDDYKEDPIATCLIPKIGDDKLQRSNKDDPYSTNEYSAVKGLGATFLFNPRLVKPDNYGTYTNNKGRRQPLISGHICNNKSCNNPYHQVNTTAEENQKARAMEGVGVKYPMVSQHVSNEQIAGMATFHQGMIATHGTKIWPDYMTGLTFGYDYSSSNPNSIHKRVIADKDGLNRWNATTGADSDERVTKISDLPNFYLPRDKLSLDNKNWRVNIPHATSELDHIPLRRATGKLAGSREGLYDSVDNYINSQGGGILPTYEKDVLEDIEAEIKAETEAREATRPKTRIVELKGDTLTFPPVLKIRRRQDVMTRQGIIG